MPKKNVAKKKASGNVTIRNSGDRPLLVLVPDADGNTAVIDIGPKSTASVTLPEGREIRAQFRPD